ncbi:hypothetical protein ACFQ1E_11465 [Sphingomonas canadensis]|uniref:Serine kinase n=1 Tax=Sphingomonas canadensis TaxID=1219257 RepID=A0ABW3H6F0_9SPHN|nr:hypothetical protein [Sphingomonas canadensis]MCW3836905.1 hypothetical protein [Sphingomonas canadensis]
MPFFYRAYELLIASDFAIPDLLPASAGAADVTITLGAIDHAPILCDTDFSHWIASPGHWLIEVRDEVRIEVREGGSVRVELAPGAEPDIANSLLLGSALSALLQQRGVLPLHASALASPDGAILVAGSSGAGKSTLQTGLARHGLPVLADDITGIVLDAGVPVAVPGFPVVRMWQETIDGFGLDASGQQRVRPDLNKFRMPVKSFRGTRQPIRTILILAPHNREDIVLEPMTSSDALYWLNRLTHRKHFYAANGMRAAHFEILTTLVRDVPVLRLWRPDTGFGVDALAARVIADLNTLQSAGAA